MSYRCTFATAAPFVLCTLFAAACGCGPSRGTVAGKVTYKNKDIAWGTVSIFASDNLQYSGEISAEGTYSIANVPSGAVKICVVSPNPGPRVFAGGEKGLFHRRPEREPFRKPPAHWSPIPEKYADLQTTTLTGAVKKDTTIDLELH